MNESAPAAAPRAVTGADYLSRIARRTAWHLWWLVIPGIILVIVGMFCDLRISIMGFMLLLVIFPMVITTAVLGAATKPAVVARTRVHRVMLGDNNIALLDEENACIVSIDYSRLRTVRRTGLFIEIVFGKSPSDIIILPPELLSDDSYAALAARVSDDTMMM
ncbi:MAG: hypothetical protein K2M00_04905 [Muribaculaceae bacterium]|nr:hypothetical protein [Muribaculaceae bacterium]